MRLAEHAVFDDTDDAGVILDTRHGVYLTLNSTATLMLRAALRSDTVEDAVGCLREQIDATDQTLESGLAKLTGQLRDRALLAAAHQDTR
ncbi:PqqD family protein [Streptomyces daliensis]|uniref:PqqD family protein n=1 Tax=Streptomyces daliensis TaxID=299421 RepID=A0A8T4IPS7_9ACTN|nr:PqqD family protein [Streptomyces daliensis]